MSSIFVSTEVSKWENIHTFLLFKVTFNYTGSSVILSNPCYIPSHNQYYHEHFINVVVITTLLLKKLFSFQEIWNTFIFTLLTCIGNPYTCCLFTHSNIFYRKKQTMTCFRRLLIHTYIQIQTHTH